MPLCYKAPPEREQFVLQLVSHMRQSTPEETRPNIMIGGKQECLDTVARFAATDRSFSSLIREIAASETLAVRKAGM